MCVRACVRMCVHVCVRVCVFVYMNKTRSGTYVPPISQSGNFLTFSSKVLSCKLKAVCRVDSLSLSRLLLWQLGGGMPCPLVRIKTTHTTSANITLHILVDSESSREACNSS